MGAEAARVCVVATSHETYICACRSRPPRPTTRRRRRRSSSASELVRRSRPLRERHRSQWYDWHPLAQPHTKRERERRDATRARARVASSMIDIDRAIRRMGILCRQAEHLTEIDSALFAGVHASELLGCRWQKLPCSSLSQISAVCAACVRACAPQHKAHSGWYFVCLFVFAPRDLFLLCAA